MGVAVDRPREREPARLVEILCLEQLHAPIRDGVIDPRLALAVGGLVAPVAVPGSAAGIPRAAAAGRPARRGGCRCAGRSRSRRRTGSGGRWRGGRSRRPAASSRCVRRRSGTSGRAVPRLRCRARGCGGAASWWSPLRCSRAAAAGWSSASRLREAISTWFWRGALTETATDSKPMSFRPSLKLAWCSPSTNSVRTSTSRSSVPIACSTAGGMAFLPVR